MGPIIRGWEPVSVQSDHRALEEWLLESECSRRFARETMLPGKSSGKTISAIARRIAKCQVDGDFLLASGQGGSNTYFGQIIAWEADPRIAEKKPADCGSRWVPLIPPGTEVLGRSRMGVFLIRGPCSGQGPACCSLHPQKGSRKKYGNLQYAEAPRAGTQDRG